MTLATEQFYAELATFAHFEQCADARHYCDLPDDWHVVIADIKGSTEAVAQGRYRDVNALGVACIVAVNNAVKPLLLPFVFGGDGATFAVPPNALVRVQSILAACSVMAADKFHLHLRVGSVAVAFLREQGKRVALAKYAVNENFHQAMLLGDGWTYADQLIKRDPNFQLQEVDAADDVDFSGFECRWNQIPSPQGETVSLLVAALSESDDAKQTIYSDILAAIIDIYGPAAQHHPVPLEQLNLSFSWRKLSIEARIRQSGAGQSTGRRYQWQLLFLALAGKYLMRRKITTAQTQWGEYKQRLRANTDYRKFDDMLRMVVAGSNAQRTRLTDYLADLKRDGKIVFGMHVSNAALITCVVSDYNHHHWHFLDGADGGYTMAAVQLKKQLAELRAK